MLNFIPFIIISSVIIISIGYFVLLIKRIKKLDDILEHQATKRKGEVKKSLPFGYPGLTFNYYSNQVDIYIRPGSKHSPPSTELTIRLSYPASNTLSIYKEDISSKIGKKLGAQDIELGFESFDKDVMIKSSDEYFARKILTGDVQDLVLKIINKHRAYISLKDDILMIVIRKIIFEESEYDELIDTGLKIVDKLEGRN